jgi:membrane protease YdiL (CAAX protease family)
VILIILERRRRSVRIRFRPFVAMAGESVLYAGLLGIVVGSATQFVVDGLDIHLAIQGFASMTMIEGLVLSIGAGLYEELVFRVLVAGGLFAVFRWSGVPVGRAGAFAVIVSALVFSAFHYIGPFGDTLALSSFLFRFFAGVVFSAIFLLRGFGIAAWTHALYDIFIVVALNA